MSVPLPHLVNILWLTTVLDPDLEISVDRGWGQSSRPLDKGEAQSPKKRFWALWASLWSTNKGGGGVGGQPPPDPFPGSTTEQVCHLLMYLEWWVLSKTETHLQNKYLNSRLENCQSIVNHQDSKKGEILLWMLCNLIVVVGYEIHFDCFFQGIT